MKALRAVLIVVLFGAAFLAGCTRKKAPELQSQLDELRGQVEQLQKQLQDSRAELEQMRTEPPAQPSPTDQPLADPAMQVKAQDSPAPVSPDAGAEPPSVTPHSAVAKPDTSGSTPGERTPAAGVYGARHPVTTHKEAPPTALQERLYNEAFLLYGQKQYALAIPRFQAFLAKYPNSSLADNSQYWIGECHLDEGRVEAALDAFQKVLMRYPEGNKVPDACFKEGVAYLRLNNTEKAAVAFRKVVDSYPGTEAGQMASSQLARMEGK